MTGKRKEGAEMRKCRGEAEESKKREAQKRQSSTEEKWKLWDSKARYTYYG